MRIRQKSLRVVLRLAFAVSPRGWLRLRLAGENPFLLVHNLSRCDTPSCVNVLL